MAAPEACDRRTIARARHRRARGRGARGRRRNPPRPPPFAPSVTAREKPMDIYEVLKEDHDKARPLLDALDETKDDEGTKRARRFAEFKIDMMMHQHVEE